MLVCFFLRLKREIKKKKSDTCSLFPPFGDPLSSCLLASHYRKTSTSASWTVIKPLTVWTTTNYGKFLKIWEYQATLPASWETCLQVKKQQLELDMEQWPGSKLGKEYVKAVYCHLAYLTYMQSTSREVLGWMKPKLESRLLVGGVSGDCQEKY